MKDLLIQERAEKKHIFKYFIVCHGCLLALLWVTHEESLYGYLKPCRCICSVSCLGLSSNDFYAFISLAGDFFLLFFHSTCFLRDVGRAGLDFPCNLVCDRCLSIFKFQLMVHADVIWKEKKMDIDYAEGNGSQSHSTVVFFPRTYVAVIEFKKRMRESQFRFYASSQCEATHIRVFRRVQLGYTPLQTRRRLIQEQLN